MLVVRLRRIGKKNKPSYRIVVAEHSVAVNGSFVSDLGYYNPYSKHFSINRDEVTDWLNKGAKPSNTVARLLEKEKIAHKSIVVIKFNKAPKKKKTDSPTVISAGAGEVKSAPEPDTDATQVTAAPVEPTEAVADLPAESAEEIAETPASPETLVQEETVEIATSVDEPVKTEADEPTEAVTERTV